MVRKVWIASTNAIGLSRGLSRAAASCSSHAFACPFTNGRPAAKVRTCCCAAAVFPAADLLAASRSAMDAATGPSLVFSVSPEDDVVLPDQNPPAKSATPVAANRTVFFIRGTGLVDWLAG